MPILIRLVAFVDYDKKLGSDDVVIIKIDNYYIQYNRAKGINADTGLHADLVSVTFAEDSFSR